MSRSAPRLLGAIVAFSTCFVAVPQPAHAARTLTLSTLTPLTQARGEMTFLGTADQIDPGTAVTVERWVSRRWAPVATGTTDESGAFIATWTIETAGLNYFRASLPATQAESAVTSPVVRTSSFGEGEPAKRFDTVTLPTVTGAQEVGTTLVVNPGTWSPKADYFTYRWNRDGVWTKRTGTKYTLSGDDLGAYVTVTAMGWRSGQMTLRDSRPTARVVPGIFTTTQPEIVGRGVVGETLRVEVSGWKPTPDRLEYQWRRDGEPIDGATTVEHTVVAEDAGSTLSVRVHATAKGVEPVDRTSTDFPVRPTATQQQRTFADVIGPYSNEPWRSDELAVSAGASPPAWGQLKRTRWDAPNAFHHAQTPRPYQTLISAVFDQNWQRPEIGAEYPGTNPSLKNADVTFTITARRFAITYRGSDKSDAMVWVDSKPVAASPIIGSGPNGSSAQNWIAITLPERRTVRVRFAGPLSFTGVDVPASEDAVIEAGPRPFTLGVLSTSFYEICSDKSCQSRNAAPALGTQTGFRVWNMSESASGYVTHGRYSVEGFEPSPFGSAKRLAGVVNAPIDALIIGGSINDVTSDAHAAAVHRLLSDLEAARPDLPVVLLGIEPIGPFEGSDFWRYQSESMTAVLASTVGRHQNVVGFIDPTPWLTGTGSIAKPAGDGNRDQYAGMDRFHLSAAGVWYYQQKVVEELHRLPLPAAD